MKNMDLIHAFKAMLTVARDNNLDIDEKYEVMENRLLEELDLDVTDMMDSVQNIYETLHVNLSFDENAILKACVGTWTPDAHVFCISCHTDMFTKIKPDVIDLLLIPQPLSKYNAATYCDKCGVTVQIEHSLAKEHNLVQMLKRNNINASMWQTGSMKHAIKIPLVGSTPEQEENETAPYYHITYDFDGDGLFIASDQDGNDRYETPELRKIVSWLNTRKSKFAKFDTVH